jgi:hypothetical protein
MPNKIQHFRICFQHLGICFQYLETLDSTFNICYGIKHFAPSISTFGQIGLNIKTNKIQHLKKSLIFHLLRQDIRKRRPATELARPVGRLIRHIVDNGGARGTTLRGWRWRAVCRDGGGTRRMCAGDRAVHMDGDSVRLRGDCHLGLGISASKDVRLFAHISNIGNHIINFFRITQYNIDAHNTHTYSPL